jgi:hypothetical protein
MRKLKGFSNSTVYEHNGRVYKRGDDVAFRRQMKYMLQGTHSATLRFPPAEWEDEGCYSIPYYERTYLDYLNDVNIPFLDKVESFEALLEKVNNQQTTRESVLIDNYLRKLETRVPVTFHNTNGVWDLHYGEVHGDLTLANILIDNDNEFVFIDPRGTQEVLLYDFAKLKQSTHMLFEKHAFADFSKMKHLYEELDSVLTDKCEPRQLNFFLMVHLLGAVPFIRKRDKNLANQFFREGLKLADLLNLKYVMK